MTLDLGWDCLLNQTQAEVCRLMQSRKATKAFMKARKACGLFVEMFVDAEVSEVRIGATASQAEETMSMVDANRMGLFAASRGCCVSYAGQLRFVLEVECKNASLRSPSESGVYAKTHELHSRASLDPACPSITSPTTRLNVSRTFKVFFELRSGVIYASLTLHAVLLCTGSRHRLQTRSTASTTTIAPFPII
jgi:hypothetical protein